MTEPKALVAQVEVLGAGLMRPALLSPAITPASTEAALRKSGLAADLDGNGMMYPVIVWSTYSGSGSEPRLTIRDGNLVHIGTGKPAGGQCIVHPAINVSSLPSRLASSSFPRSPRTTGGAGKEYDRHDQAPTQSGPVRWTPAPCLDDDL